MAITPENDDTINVDKIQEKEAAKGVTVQSGINVLKSVSGTNTLTAVLSTVIDAYETGAEFLLTPVNDNTGAVTIDIDGEGAKAITDPTGTALAESQLLTGTLHKLIYNGTEFRLQNPAVKTIDFSASAIVTIPVGFAMSVLDNYTYRLYPDNRVEIITFVDLTNVASGFIGVDLNLPFPAAVTTSSFYSGQASIRDAGTGNVEAGKWFVITTSKLSIRKLDQTSFSSGPDRICAASLWYVRS